MSYMRRKTFVAAVVLSFCAAALCASAVPADKAKFHVFLLVGQSNMAGRGVLDKTNRVSVERVLKLDASGKWVSAVEPLHYDKKIAGAGLGASFARAVADADASITVGLVPVAVGGTGIDRWVEGGDLWSNAVARTRIALKSGTLKGILWHQGESDASSAKRTAQWGKKFKSMIVSFRREFGEVPFIAGELGHYFDERKCRWREINAQLHRLEGVVSGYLVVPSEGLKAKSDNVHFDTRSLREFGRRYAEAYKRLTAK